MRQSTNNYSINTEKIVRYLLYSIEIGILKSSRGLPNSYSCNKASVADLPFITKVPRLSLKIYGSYHLYLLSEKDSL